MALPKLFSDDDPRFGEDELIANNTINTGILGHCVGQLNLGKKLHPDGKLSGAQMKGGF